MLGKLSIVGAVAGIFMIPTALPAQMGGAVNPGVHSPYRSGRSPDWLKMKNARGLGQREMAITQGRLPFVFGFIVMATVLITAPAAHAICKSPKNICKHFDDCLHSGPNNKKLDEIRAGVKARNAQIVLAGAEACASDLGKKQQWDNWARGCAEREFVEIARVELELGKAHCDHYSQ